MVTLGYIFLVLLAIAIIAFLVTIIMSLADIRRYFRIRRM
ncbi:MAG: DUF6893 family small protein [Sciscionella sp.]